MTMSDDVLDAGSSPVAARPDPILDADSATVAARPVDPGLILDAESSPETDRVTELLTRMTVEEKIAQLYGVWVGLDSAGDGVAPHQHELTGEPVDFPELIKRGLGQLTRPFGTRPVEPRTGAFGLAQTQREIVAAGRFGIPALVHEECLTGLTAWQATIYPAPLSWGASFDPDLVERMAARIGTTMRRLGIHQGLAPLLDVARDLRWGRVEETIGEDPYLVGTIGSAYVRGLESSGIVATLKHFAGYSASRGGRNLAPVSIGRRELADVLLPPFELALRAGARSVMNSYTDLDGVPTAADAWLLTEILRETYGFTGTVVADYFSVSFLQTLHGIAADPADAARLALTAGIDVELPTVNCFGEPLIAAVHDGRIDLALIDRALERVLRQKAELGLLDPDFSPDPDPDADFTLDDAESRFLARTLAEESVVLLANNGILPLAPGRRIAVVGPRADAASAMLGCYSFPMHVGAQFPGTPLGVELPTLLESLREQGFTADYAEGCTVLGGTDADLAAAVEAARAAEVCVAVLGDLAGLFGRGTSGEGCDVADLRLPGRQGELLEALIGTGTPVVLVLLVGRSYEISEQLDRLAAVVCSFFPGEEGGPAVAGVLAGTVNPSGRLPLSFPRAGAGQPATYLAAPLGAASEVSNIDPTALFGFGHGLSYAPAEWVSAACADPDWPTDGESTVEVTVHNPHDRTTTEIVQLYLHDPVAETVRPVQQLIAAARIELAPGQTRTARFTLHADLTSYTGLAGHRIVDPGTVELRVGASSADIRQVLKLDLTGRQRRIGADRVLAPGIEVGP
jgi:beta-glucosidase